MGVREQAVEELTAKVKAVQEITDRYGDQDIPAEDYTKLTGMLGEIRTLKDTIKRTDDVKGAKGEIAGLIASLENPVGAHKQPAGLTQAQAEAQQGKGFAESVVDSEEYATFLSGLGVKMGGEVSDRIGVKSPGFAVDSRILVPRRGRKSLVTGLANGSAGAFITSDDLGLQDEGTTRRPLTVGDLITKGQTGTDTVEYVRVTTETNNAAPVAEATSVSNGAKPESAVGFTRVTTTVKSIAHWIPITRRALADAGQMRTYLDGFLRYGLDEEIEDQMITGDGTGENFTGLANVSGVQAQAFDTDTLVTTRKARTLVRTVGRSVPNAYLMNPEDWEEIELKRDDSGGAGTGAFLFGGPAQLAAPRLWGLPVVESEAVPAGTAYVGDFRRMVLWDREQAQVLISDSHADFFIRNILVMLAELRAAFGITRPSAFVEVDLVGA